MNWFPLKEVVADFVHSLKHQCIFRIHVQLTDLLVDVSAVESLYLYPAVGPVTGLRSTY